MMAVSLLGFVAGLPFISVRLAAVSAFIPSYEAGLLVIDFATAILLFSLFAYLRSWALLIIAAGYVFDGLMVIPHALTFPGAFTASGLLGAGPQTTAWLYEFWHLGFPLSVLTYALLVRRRLDHFSGSVWIGMAGACAASVALTAGLTLLTIVGHDWLPILVRRVGDANGIGIGIGVAPGVWLVTLGTLIVLWHRSVPTVFELWLMVVLVAWLVDIGFAALLGEQRYDLGFYAARIYGLLAAGFVLANLLIETNRVYGGLMHALALAESRNADLLRVREEFARIQRHEAIGRLVGGVAHDFNNILTVVTGAIDLTLDEPEISDRSRRLLQASLAATTRGERINEQLLSLIRRQASRPEILDLNEVITSLEPFLAHAVEDRVQIVTRLSPVVWPAKVDRAQFETALVNIVVNARDAMSDSGTVLIETTNATPARGTVPELHAVEYVLVRVSDNGPGMAPEVQAHAFDPFFTTKQPGEGTGLGLSQVHGFARASGGGTRIVSAAGTGTTVEIFLPRSGSRVAEPEVAGLGLLREVGAGETILVVEDDPAVMEVAVSALHDLGYRTWQAAGAEQALNILCTGAAIDVLFADVVLPGGMNGAQLAFEAQRIRPDLKVLLTSGYATRMLAQQHGVPETLDLLPKPYSRGTLASRIRGIMGR